MVSDDPVMDAAEILEIAQRGEDGRHQFKADVTKASSLASELVAFANGDGGEIFIGIGDDRKVRALDAANVARVNQLLSNAASNSVRPPVNPQTENVAVGGGVVIVVTIPKGLNRPYMDDSGSIWVKSGSDKRKVTSREELQRMFQSAGLLHADDLAVAHSSLADLDSGYFGSFFEKKFGRPIADEGLSMEQILLNMRLLREGQLTVAGALLFAKDPSPLLPVFHVKAVTYPGTEIHLASYLESADYTGRIKEQFEGAMAFILRHLRRVQNGKGVNTIGDLEVPQVVFEELVANALIHRDYFLSAPVRIFIFDDRVEIVSPGHLPNNLTIENIKSGNSNVRNPVLASHATYVLPYRGLGSGIIRALRAHPRIDFVDDREGNKFVAVVRREPFPARVGA